MKCITYCFDIFVSLWSNGACRIFNRHVTKLPSSLEDNQEKAVTKADYTNRNRDWHSYCTFVNWWICRILDAKSASIFLHPRLKQAFAQLLDFQHHLVLHLLVSPILSESFLSLQTWQVRS